MESTGRIARASPAEQIGIDVLSLGEDRQPHQPQPLSIAGSQAAMLRSTTPKSSVLKGLSGPKTGSARAKPLGTKLYAFDGHSPLD